MNRKQKLLTSRRLFLSIILSTFGALINAEDPSEMLASLEPERSASTSKHELDPQKIALYQQPSRPSTPEHHTNTDTPQRSAINNGTPTFATVEESHKPAESSGDDSAPNTVHVDEELNALSVTPAIHTSGTIKVDPAKLLKTWNRLSPLEQESLLSRLWKLITGKMGFNDFLNGTTAAPVRDLSINDLDDFEEAAKKWPLIQNDEHPLLQAGLTSIKDQLTRATHDTLASTSLQILATSSEPAAQNVVAALKAYQSKPADTALRAKLETAVHQLANNGNALDAVIADVIENKMALPDLSSDQAKTALLSGMAALPERLD